MYSAPGAEDGRKQLLLRAALLMTAWQYLAADGSVGLPAKQVRLQYDHGCLWACCQCCRYDAMHGRLLHPELFAHCGTCLSIHRALNTKRTTGTGHSDGACAKSYRCSTLCRSLPSSLIKSSLHSGGAVLPGLPDACWCTRGGAGSNSKRQHHDQLPVCVRCT